jgi:hypothetical protein
MLPDPLRLLISAYASGDLSPRRRSAAVRLLRHSAEARRLLKELKVNRRRLRALPKPELPADFTARVVSALPEQPPIIRPSVLIRPMEHRFSRASRIVTAAAIVVAVAVGLYLVGSTPRQPVVPDRPIATRPPVKPATNDVPAMIPEPVANRNNSDEPADPIPEPAAVVKNPPDRPINSTLPQPDPLGTNSRPLPKVIKIDPPRPLALPVRDLESADPRKRLLQELRKADVQHIDLFCKDSTKGFERLQAAIRGRGVKLIVDGFAQETVKRKIRGQFMIFCDDLTASEWGQVLQSVAAADKKAGDGLFDRVVVLPFDVADQNELTTVFGADLSQPDPRRPGAGAIDARRDESKKEVREAFAALMLPRRTPANSKDVRQFLDGHRDRTISEIAVMLVLRMPGN